MLARSERPCDRRTFDRQHLLDLVEQIEWVAGVPVELVDERDHRGVTQAAHFEQFDRAFLDAARGIDDHQGRVDRGKRAIGIL